LDNIFMRNDRETIGYKFPLMGYLFLLGLAGTPIVRLDGLPRVLGFGGIVIGSVLYWLVAWLLFWKER
jgi:hypothetical protein